MDKISIMKIKYNTMMMKIYKFVRKVVSEIKMIQEDIYMKIIFLKNRDSNQDTSDFIKLLFYK